MLSSSHLRALLSVKVGAAIVASMGIGPKTMRPKKEKKQEKKEAANLAVADAQPALFLASVSGIVHGPSKTVHLAEEKVVLMQCDNGVWVLDTGVNNHMTGTREALNQLDDAEWYSVFW